MLLFRTLLYLYIYKGKRKMNKKQSITKNKQGKKKIITKQMINEKSNRSLSAKPPVKQIVKAIAGLLMVGGASSVGR